MKWLQLARLKLALVIAAAGSMFGCGLPLTNPSFDLSVNEARRTLDSMKDDDRERLPRLERPVVILDGTLSWGFYPWNLKHTIAERTRGRFVIVSYPLAVDFDDCRRTVIKAVDRELGVVNDRETVEVDVIGMSLGGVVAVWSSLEDPALGKRLKIRNLYTISSPLSGSTFASVFGNVSLVPIHRDLRPGTPFLERLAKANLDCSVISYTRLEDGLVGARYAALPGHRVYWLSNPPLENSHLATMTDPRIFADILRRLRGEATLAMCEPAPLPGDALIG